MRNCINRPDEKKKWSIGEKVVASVLDELGVKYFYDKPCSNLRGVKNGTLRFDFCIPKDQNIDHNTDTPEGPTDGYDDSNYIVLEYNGIFHYHIIQNKTTRYTLTKQQMNDYIKEEYCRINNIDILWIPYWHCVKKVKDQVADFVTKRIPV